LAPALEDLRSRFRELTVPPPRNLHLTLAFLGEIDAAATARAAAALAMTATAAAKSWTVGWGNAGAFPSDARARVLWLGLAEPELTIGIQRLLAAELGAGNLPVDDRPFRPHLTLARLRRDLSRERAEEVRKALAAMAPPPDSKVTSLVLYRSRLGRGPAVYEELSRADL
jgi:2'-5' RNA ligase